MNTMAARSILAAIAAATLLSPALAQEAPVRPGGPSGGDIVGYRQIHQPAIGRGGMVVSQNALATRVGVDVLKAGGNAVDAAVAVAFAAAVTLPRAGNIGGGGYMLIHMAAKGDRPATTLAIDYYGQASRHTTPDLLVGADGAFDPAKGMSMKGVAIPGTVSGLWEAHRRYGSQPWGKLLAPAIAIARDGVILSDDEAEATAAQAKAMGRDPGARQAFFRPDGSAYRPGDRFVQRDLARTLKAIAARGADGFYKGAVAERMVAGIRIGGGIIDAKDLADYRAVVSEPVLSDYRGTTIAYMPPTASGVSVAQAMNILERFPIGAMRWGSAAGMHVLAEALKIAAADRRLVGGGPDWRTPVAGLTSKAYAARRAALIRPDTTLDANSLPDGNPYPFESRDTTHFSVADAAGNAVSNTYTLSASYGAHVVAPGTGFLLNNSLGNLAWGSRAKDREATRPLPGKRVGSTITPIIAFKAGKPWLVTGTPGGGYIVATMVQLLSNVLDHGLNISEAAERPRINQGGGDAALELEDGFSPDIVPLLEAKGHAVKPSLTMGSTQSIMIDNDRFLGAADTRRPDALALGAR
jgi:gamma-glutamyltranspeptidase/glutathione hydrolase